MGMRTRGRLRAGGSLARAGSAAGDAMLEGARDPVGRVVGLLVGIVGRRRGGAHSMREPDAKAARELLTRAGLADAVDPLEFVRCQRRLPALGCLAGFAAGLLAGFPVALLGAAAGWAFGRAGPRWMLTRRADARRRSCERELAPMLDVLAMGVRAGLSFDGAFGVYVGHGKGLLARECTEAYRTWTSGAVSRETALDGLARHIGSRDVRRFVDMVEQSVALGSSLAPVLSDLASEMRRRRRADAEERIAKAPVKMLVPTGVLILPAMLLVVMGPVLLELAGDLG